MSLAEKFNLDTPLSIEKLIKYNKEAIEVINYNKQEIKLLLKELEMELKELPYPDINKIRKFLKNKSKKFVISKDFNIGNLASFGANINDIENSYKLVMLPYKGDNKARISFKYYPRSRNFKNLFDRLAMALRTEKVKVKREIIKTNSGNFIRFSTLDEKDNAKFWYVVRLWAKI
jgi:hypothetical protein